MLNKKNEITLNDILDRDSLTEKEIINLNTKKKSIPVEYFRKNLFNATARESRELTRNKTIYDDNQTKIQVNRSLHQRHRDLLSIIFTDNKGTTTPAKDGSYYIHTSLYDLSKKMGYSPLQGINIINKFLGDLQQTLMTIDTKNVGVVRHQLLGKSYFDKYNTKEFKIEIPSYTAKYHIFNFSVEIPKEINQKIIAIPSKYAKTKALVSYILSNKALKNGITFENVCNKLDIPTKNMMSKFKRELIDNKQILEEFNIVFDEETKIIKYQKLEGVKFHRGISKEEIFEILEDERKNEREQEELEKFGFKKDKYVGKILKHKSSGLFGEEIKTSLIKDIEVKTIEDENKVYRLVIKDDSNEKDLFTSWFSIEEIDNIYNNLKKEDNE